MEILENVLWIIFGALLALFLGLLGAIWVLYRRQQRRRIKWQRLEEKSNSAKKILEKDLVLAFREIKISDSLEEAIRNDESGLLPHCLLIVQNSLQLMDKLVNLSVCTENYKYLSEKYIKTAIKIPVRIEDFLSHMQPPIDGKLLTTRADALIFELNKLTVLAVKLNKNLNLKWLCYGVHNIEQHLSILRSIAMNTTIKKI